MRFVFGILRKARSVAGRLRRRTVSLADTIDLGAPEVARDPFPHYEELRGGGSVQFLRQHNAWIVLGFDDVQFAFAHPNLFSNSPYHDVDAVLLAADPPEHTAIRRIVSRYFSSDAIDRLSAFAGVFAESLIKPEMDLVSDYAVRVSQAVAAQLLGFDDDAVGAIRAAEEEHVQEFVALTRALDRIAGRATMYERLIAEGLDDAGARSLIRLLWLASTSTTDRVIAHSAMSLLQHDDVHRSLERDSALVPAFVEEVVRLHPPEQMIRRIATEAVPLGGTTIAAGSLVYLCIAAANRDPAKFENASSFRLDRTARHISFGFGVHHCVGVTLGRRVIASAVIALLKRAPRFRAVEPLSAVTYRSAMTAHSIERLVIDTRSTESS